MGTINYKTSDYITIGLKPYDSDDFIDENGNTDYDEISSCYEADYDNIKYLLDKYNFYYYHITIEPGYYEGFSIDIENNFGLCYNDYESKREAQKEITQIKQFLIDCVNTGLCKVSPGWCTAYYNYYESIEAINEAIKEMREEVRTAPTYKTYKFA